MRQRLENESRLQILEARVRDVPAPSEAQLRAYYDAHPETFTEPEQTKVSIILLKVDPSSSAEVWDAARKEAAALHERLKKGADFAELARMHSGDASAAQGGDMGYIHRGMLGELAQKAIDALKPGQNTAPVELLEGIALFRLVERQKPNLNDLATVKARAHDLWRRDEGERAWKGLIAKLRRETPIELHEELYTPLPAAGQGAASGAKQERSGRHP
jgi:parvulin-like peptidyl-prolyl isomerase